MGNPRNFLRQLGSKWWQAQLGRPPFCSLAPGLLWQISATSVLKSPGTLPCSTVGLPALIVAVMLWHSAGYVVGRPAEDICPGQASVLCVFATRLKYE